MKHQFYFSALIFFGIVACSADQPATSLYGEEPKQASASDPVSCRDANGNAVDWWVILKGPGVKKGGKKLPNQYLYRDSTSNDCSDSNRVTDCWQSNGPPIAAPSGNALAETLKQSYMRPKLSRIYYNDDTCDAVQYNDWCEKHSFTVGGGHAKGALLVGPKFGFWLTHSYPRFPSGMVPTLAPYKGFPGSVWEVGQHAFCMTIKASEGAKILDHLGVIESNNYAWQKADTANVQKDPMVQNIKTKANVDLALYGKSTKWGKDFFSDLLAETLNSDLLAQTWHFSFGDESVPGYFPDFCRTAHCDQVHLVPATKDGDPTKTPTICPAQNRSKFQHNIRNIPTIKYSDEITWSTCDDHAKWAITTKGSGKSTVCFADNNRSAAMRTRGGGAACLEDKSLWNAMFKLIADLPDECGAPSSQPFCGNHK